nr:hypothetical protein [uncultured Selenomonas sp.]
MMEEIKAALEQIDQKIIRKEQEIERCEKRLKDAKAELVRARDRRNTIIGTYITTLGGGDTKSLDAFFTLAQETLSMPQEERAAKAADDTTGEPAAKDPGHSGEDSH